MENVSLATFTDRELVEEILRRLPESQGERDMKDDIAYIWQGWDASIEFSFNEDGSFSEN